MEIVLENGVQKLIPSIEENWLLNRDDLDKAEEDKYYFKFAYLPPTVTIVECEDKYIEVEKEDEDDD
ncbi:MAG: hypothetical protein J6T10_26820 [Methanobrevibacter sp.]|nr:hypothetical protein [Methanobrevibacter sp.]